MQLCKIIGLGIIVLLLFTAGCTSGDNQNDNSVKKDYLDLSHIRDKILEDKQRPTYHFVMPEGIAESFLYFSTK